MKKYDKQASFSEVDNLDKSEEVYSIQKKGRHTFCKLAGDFFDNIRSASFWYCVANVLLNIFVILIIALILWGVFFRR